MHQRFWVKELARVSGSDSRQITCPSNGNPVGIRSHAGCPLLIDPDQKAAAEYFAILRARLLSARAKSAIHSVLIASPQRQDGKSLTSVNLAISLAQLQRERILLVDGDLRANGITRILGLEKYAGLADFLQGLAPFDECIKVTTLPYLYVAPAGNIPPDSLPAILEGSRWPEFLQKGKQDFGLIVVDSVPVSAPIADFELSLAACDAALLVVHLRRTTREALEHAAQQMRNKLLGVVVNSMATGANLDYHSTYGAPTSS